MSATSIMPLSANASYGYIRDGKVWLKGFLNYPDRIIGEVRESEALSINYFAERYKLAQNKVDNLLYSIDIAENKGSFLMRLIHLKEALTHFDALGNFIILIDKLNAQEEYLNSIIAVNKEKNKLIKESIIAELEVVKESFDWKEASLTVKELKDKWIKTGTTAKEFEASLEDKFNAYWSQFYERRKQFFEQRQVIIDQQKKHCEEILNKVKALAILEDFEFIFAEISKLKEEWRSITDIPKKERRDMNLVFKKAVEEASRAGYSLKKRRILTEPKKADLTRWLDIIVEAELLAKGDLRIAGAEVKNVQAEWKKAGFIPNSHKDELMLQFRNACDRAIEVGFLHNSVLKRYPEFESKPVKDKYKIKLAQLRYLLTKDKDDLDTAVRTKDNYGAADYDPDEAKVLNSKIELLKRRVNMKSTILKELEEVFKVMTETV